jgi:hypothetical protein
LTGRRQLVRNKATLGKRPEQFIHLAGLIFILASQVDLVSRLIGFLGDPAGQCQVSLGRTRGLDIKIYAAGHAY